MKTCLSVLLTGSCSLLWLGLLSFASDKQQATPDAEKARVFITDSQSWSIAGASGGGGGAYGGSMAGGARPQTAEIIKNLWAAMSPSDN